MGDLCKIIYKRYKKIFTIIIIEGFAKRPKDALLAKQNLDSFPRISFADSEKNVNMTITRDILRQMYEENIIMVKNNDQVSLRG